jgi:hypothetical protein
MLFYVVMNRVASYRVVVMYIYVYFIQSVPDNIIKFQDHKEGLFSILRSLSPFKAQYTYEQQYHMLHLQRITFCQPTVSVGVAQYSHNKHHSVRACKTLKGFTLQWTWDHFFLSDRNGFLCTLIFV